MTPSLPDYQLKKGYLTLPPNWLKAHPLFSLNIPLKPRFISPHPYTNQDIVALARGPLVYCVEDFDNAWVEDHFKTLVLDPASTVEENRVDEKEMGEPYVALTVQGVRSFLDVRKKQGPEVLGGEISYREGKGIKELCFIPYALRDNRGGKGHMRVGIRRKH